MSPLTFTSKVKNWKRYVKVKVARSCPTLCDPGQTLNSLWRLFVNSAGQNTGMFSLSIAQGIFSTQGSNPGLTPCRQILYQLSHKTSPRKLEWVAYPFSRRSSQPRNHIGVCCIASRFFTNWAMTEAQETDKQLKISWNIYFF